MWVGKPAQTAGNDTVPGLRPVLSRGRRLVRSVTRAAGLCHGSGTFELQPVPSSGLLTSRLPVCGGAGRRVFQSVFGHRFL